MRWIYLIGPLTFLLVACGAEPQVDNVMHADALEPAAGNLAMNAGHEAPTILCREINERVTEEECEDVNALKEDVKPGAAALDVPGPMTRGRHSQVTLVIDRRPLAEIAQLDAPAFDNTVAVEDVVVNAADMTDDVAVNAVDTVQIDGDTVVEPRPRPMAENPAPTPKQTISDLPGQDYGFSSKVGRFMRATLAGQGFEVRLISPGDPIQEIPAGGQATWIWEVTPREGGQRSLTARTEAIAKVRDKVIPLGDGQTMKTVMVEVRAIDSIKDVLVALPDWLKLITGVLIAVTALVGAWYGLRKAMRSKAN